MGMEALSYEFVIKSAWTKLVYQPGGQPSRDAGGNPARGELGWWIETGSRPVCEKRQ